MECSTDVREIRVNSCSLKATVRGIEYTWIGGFGAVIKSFEPEVKLNEVRRIGNIVFYARTVSRVGWLFGWLCGISWCPQQEIDAQWIRDFKTAMFS